MKMKNQKAERHELYYERARNGKRMAAILFDAFCCFATFFLLLLGTFPLIDSLPLVQEAERTREDLGLSSGIYVRQEGELVLLTEALDGEDLSLDERSRRLDEAVTAFYGNPSFFLDGLSLYQEDKENALSLDGQKMFQDGERLLVNDDYDQEYCDFYEESFLAARGYLQENDSYRRATRTVLLSFAVGIVLTFLLPFPFFFLLVPLLFKRTRQTLGMRLTRIALLDADGLSLTASKTTYRFLFLFLVEVLLSLFSFLLPLFLSFGMLLLSKRHQTLHDYVCNTYAIETEGATIYRDKAEYLLAQEEGGKALTLEDPSYRPVSGVDHEEGK